MLRAALVVATTVVFLSPSAAAQLPLPPPNDNRANAILVDPPATLFGTTVSATSEESDPQFVLRPGAVDGLVPNP